MMAAYHNEDRTKRLNMKSFDIRSSEFNNSSKKKLNKLIDNIKSMDQESDSDYLWFISELTKTMKPTKVIRYKDETEVEEEDDTEVEDAEDVNDIKVENETEKDIDPHYAMFLKSLTKNGNTYKVEITEDGKAPYVQDYEKNKDNNQIITSQEMGDIGEMELTPRGKRKTWLSLGKKGAISSTKEVSKRKRTIEESRGCITVSQGKQGAISSTKEVSKRKRMIEEPHGCITVSQGKQGAISSMKEVSKRKRMIEEPRGCITVESCYQLFLKGCDASEYGVFVYNGKEVKYEENVACSDSDVMILDDVNDFTEVNKKEKSASAKKAQKEKLLKILKKPYSRKEHKQLLKYVEDEKPICRLLPLRQRNISSALSGATKSVLDDVPTLFRLKLNAAKNKKEQPRVLNLLRMFRFWLEHLPNEGSFTPWLDDDCLEVLPRSTRMK